MKLFKRWRRSRSTAAPEPATSNADEATPDAERQDAREQVHTQAPAQSQQARRASRRPSTMGRTLAEQAYLAEAAVRAAKNQQS